MYMREIAYKPSFLGMSLFKPTSHNKPKPDNGAMTLLALAIFLSTIGSGIIITEVNYDTVQQIWLTVLSGILLTVSPYVVAMIYTGLRRLVLRLRKGFR